MPPSMGGPGSHSGESEESDGVTGDEGDEDESADGESMDLNTPYRKGRREGRSEGRSIGEEGTWRRVSMGGAGVGGGTGVGGDITVALVCVVGALQRMTVKVPDRSTTRTLILNSIVTILTALQTVKLTSSPDGKNRAHNVSENKIHFISLTHLLPILILIQNA